MLKNDYYCEYIDQKKKENNSNNKNFKSNIIIKKIDNENYYLCYEMNERKNKTKKIKKIIIKTCCMKH